MGVHLLLKTLPDIFFCKPNATDLLRRNVPDLDTTIYQIWSITVMFNDLGNLLNAFIYLKKNLYINTHIQKLNMKIYNTLESWIIFPSKIESYLNLSIQHFSFPHIAAVFWAQWKTPSEASPKWRYFPHWFPGRLWCSSAEQHQEVPPATPKGVMHYHDNFLLKS